MHRVAINPTTAHSLSQGLSRSYLTLSGMSTNPNFGIRGLPRQATRGAGRGRGRSRPVTASATGTRGLASNVAALHRDEILVEERSATPTTIGRHFSERKFADAPISNQSKAGLKHE